MNPSDVVLIAASTGCIFASLVGLKQAYDEREKNIKEKESQKFMETIIIPYIDSLDYEELLIVAQAIILSTDEEAEVRLIAEKLLENFDDNFNNYEKLRKLIKEKLLTFTSSELKAFKINYVNKKMATKVYKKTHSLTTK